MNTILYSRNKGILPNPDYMEDEDIIINNNVDNPTISIKNSNGGLSTFKTTDNYVSLTEDETITGKKTFSSKDFAALLVKRNDTTNGASIGFLGASSTYGYIGFNASAKDKLLLRWGSDASKVYSILDSSTTYINNGTIKINGVSVTPITSLNGYVTTSAMESADTATLTSAKSYTDSAISTLSTSIANTYYTQALVDLKIKDIDVSSQLTNYALKTELPTKVSLLTNDAVFDKVTYSSADKKIYFYAGTTLKATIDATDFIKDGMVSGVNITDGYLVVNFNTDAGQDPIKIAISDIFNASNYYTKSDIDNKNYLAASGNAASATKLNTARKLTIGSTGLDFDGTKDLTWTLDLIGAAAKSHTHTKSLISDFPSSLPANGGNADTLDNYHASSFLLKTGGTMSNFNSIVTTASTTTNIVPDALSIANSPFARDSWHDLFAFLNCHTITDHQTTTDGTTWTDSTDDLSNLFCLKDLVYNLILAKDLLARRFTLGGTISCSLIKWFAVGVSYTYPFSQFRILIEGSKDKETWTTLHSSEIKSNSDTHFCYAYVTCDYAYLRFTFTKTTELTTGSVRLICLKGFTTRRADLGRGIEFESPIDWDAKRNIFPHTSGERYLGTSARKWAAVYANSFVGTATLVSNALIIQGNGSTMATYNGSQAKSVNLTKASIGLSNVDNTADSSKTVAKANLLTTTRTVSGGVDIPISFTYNGAANSTATIGFLSSSATMSGVVNYPWHRIAKLDVITSAATDKSILLYLSLGYSGGSFGLIKLNLRTNSTSQVSSCDAVWLCHKGFSTDDVKIGIYNVFGATYADAFLKLPTGWGNVVIRAIGSDVRGTITKTWELVNSREVADTTATDKLTSTECWATIEDAATDLHSLEYSAIVAATEGGRVGLADYATSLQNRTLTIGNTGHNFNGTANVTWSLSEIGAIPNTAEGLYKAINLLSTGSAIPGDNDYFISLYANGGTATTSYHRRPISTLWTYVKSKADSTYVTTAKFTEIIGNISDILTEING